MATLGSQLSLDRRSDKRSDAAWVADRLAGGASRFLLLIDLKPAIHSSEDQKTGSIRWFTGAELTQLKIDTAEAMYLGDGQDGASHFAVAVTEHYARHVPGGPYCLKPYVDVRSLAMQGVLQPEELAICGQARALAHWHDTHRCCSKCGGQNRVKDGGWRRQCWSCKLEHFPRTDPVVIMLVTQGDDCLLSHEKRFQPNFFSTLAGFVEPGEDIESAVRREVKEEVGIDIGRVTYHSSQPWPFPHSLMIGCHAEALTREINLDTKEIETAMWVTREEAGQMLMGRHGAGYQVPGRHAIAHNLIRAFVESRA